jgi:hypothetical protein
LINDELVEIGVRKHATPTALAVADSDVAEIARGNMRVEGLDGAAQFCRCFGRRAQPVRRARLALALEDCRDALGLVGEQRFNDGAARLAQAIRLALGSVKQCL